MTGSNPAARGFVVANAGACGDEVEHLDDLRAEAAGELPGAAERVLARDPALLVRGRPERQVAGAEQSVVRDDAVAGREHVGQVGAHLPVDHDRALDAELSSGRRGELSVGSHADDHEHDVGREADRRALGAACEDVETGGRAVRRHRRSRRRACCMRR